MHQLIGFDTGGTFTDAVLAQSAKEGTVTIKAKAKAPTTHDAYSKGIGVALDQILKSSAVSPGQIDLVCLSTTLATNALVEDRGGAVLVLMIGFEPNALDRAGLRHVIRDDPIIFIRGGHNAAGEEAQALDEYAIDAALQEHGNKVSGCAVIAEFSVINPSHELRAMARVNRQFGLGVTCSHHLTAKLNAPKRAVTTILNARIVPIIEDLITSCHRTLRGHGIDAPLMIVRGDGSLVSDKFAASRPIETILSGPAASLIGASWLCGAVDAIVSDIGGTTTDVAVLHNGLPAIDPHGACVGGHRTMVEAVAMHTIGLGGDSQVHVRERGLSPFVVIGPRRVIPVGSAAQEFPERIVPELELQLARDKAQLLDGQFAMLTAMGERLRPDAAKADKTMLDQLTSQPMPLEKLCHNAMMLRRFERLVGSGLVQRVAFTPSDALHLLDIGDLWPRHASYLAGQLLARQIGGNGKARFPSAENLAQQTVLRLQFQSARALLDVALGADRICVESTDDENLINSAIMWAMADPVTERHVLLKMGLAKKLIGLGASAPFYYPLIGKTLDCETIVPPHAEVANAIGAVVGQIRVKFSIKITTPGEGLYRIMHENNPETFDDLDKAKQAAKAILRTTLGKLAEQAGAKTFRLGFDWSEKSATVENRYMFVEGTLEGTAIGRPSFGVKNI